ncbi:MAG: hypothetical protein QF535_14320 [Anaerolineales bacterium]|nr:hypothetical protein [Anaerolineales bacterium]
MALQDNPIRSIYVTADVTSGTLGTGGIIDVLLSGTGSDPNTPAIKYDRSASSSDWKEITVGSEFWGVSNKDIWTAQYSQGLPPTIYLGELDEDLLAADTTITVDDGAKFATSCVIIIEDEIIKYTGKSTNDLTGCTRGYFDTIDVQHDGTASTIYIYTWYSGEVLSVSYESEPKVYGIRVKLVTAMNEKEYYPIFYTHKTFRFEIPEQHVIMVLYDDVETETGTVGP